MNYPKIKYHVSCLENGKKVMSAEEEKTLGPGWGESPAEALELSKGEKKPANYKEHMGSWESKEEKASEDDGGKSKRGRKKKDE